MVKGVHKKLVLIWAELLVFFVILYINVDVLHYQTDPFIATTVNIAKLLVTFKKIEAANDFVLSNWPNSWWQVHTMEYLRYIPLSGIFVYLISMILGTSINLSAHLPIPLFVYILFLHIICKYIYYTTLEIRFNSLHKITLLFILISSAYGFLAMFSVGLFYVLEYHGIYYSYMLVIYGLFVMMVFKREGYTNYADQRISKMLFLISIIFVASLFNHYEFPVTFSGGLFFYYVALYVTSNAVSNAFSRNFLIKLRNVILLFAILILSQQVYMYMVSSRLNTLSIGYIYLISIKLLQSIKIYFRQSEQISVSSGYPFSLFLSYSRIIWHSVFIILALIGFVIAIKIVYYSRSKRIGFLQRSYLYILALGRDIVWIILYFVIYQGRFSPWLKSAWLLTSLISYPIILSNNLEKSAIYKKIKTTLIIILMLSLISWATFMADFSVRGYYAFPGQVQEEARLVTPFISEKLNIHDTQVKLSGSIAYTSTIYSLLPLNTIRSIQLTPTGEYIKLGEDSKKHVPVDNILLIFKEHKVTFFGITSFELENNFYGGLYQLPLNKIEMSTINTQFRNSCDVIYSSDYNILFRIQ